MRYQRSLRGPGGGEQAHDPGAGGRGATSSNTSAALENAREVALVDIVVKGRNVEVPEHYRVHVADKMARIERYDSKVIRYDVELFHELSLIHI